MLIQKRSTRLGAALIIFALVLRLLTTAWYTEAAAVRQSPQDPGELPRPTTGALSPTQSTALPQPLPTAPQPAVFDTGDLEYVRMQYAADCAYRPDLQALLLQELSWELSLEAPSVLILHTHASESYTPQPGQTYTESAQYRTLDTDYNMVAIGDLLAQKLEEMGIGVIHDRQIHDYPSYNAAYANSRAAVQEYLAQYPSIVMVLDLHRDAAENSDGSQYATSALVDGRQVAQLMLLVGTDASGTVHPQWQENLALALKLQVLLEKKAPGITRRSILRAQRFNHDLSPGAMIVEVGTAGNTLQEALGAMEILADAIGELMHGAIGELV